LGDYTTLLMIFGAFVIFFMMMKRISRPDITGEQARGWVEEGARLVDVRTASEFATGSIPGAVHIPLSQIAQRSDELMPKDSRLILFCQSGMRSAKAVQILRNQGFSDVHNLGARANWR